MSELREMIEQTFDKVKGMVDVNTVVGNPIVTPDGTTLIPITRVSFGVGGGGMSKPGAPSDKVNFSCGTGAGVTISPVAFITINNGNSRVLYVNQSKQVTTVDRIVDMVPDAIDKFANVFGSKKAADTNQDEEIQYE